MKYFFAIIFVLILPDTVHPGKKTPVNRFENEKQRKILAIDVEKMKENMLEDVDLCSDFVGYICGQNKSLVNTYLWKYEQPKDVFGSQNFLTRIELKAKDFYDSCINHQTIEHLKNTQLYQSLGGMPILEGSRNFSIESIEAAFGRLGFPALIGFRMFAQGTEKEYLVVYPESRREMELYPEFFKKFMLRNGVEADSVIKEYEVHKKFYRTALETEHSVTMSDLKITYSQLKLLFPSYQWDVYFNYTIKDSMPVRVFRKELMTSIFQLMEENGLSVVNYMWSLFLKDIGEDCHHPLIQFFDPYRKLIDRPTYDTYKVSMILRYLENSYDNVIWPVEWITEDLNKNIKEVFKQCNQWVLHYDPESEKKLGDVEIDPKDFYKNFFKVIERTGNENVRNKKSKISDPENIFNGFFKKGFYNDSFPMVINFARFGHAVAELVLNQATGKGFSWIQHGSEERFNELSRCLDFYESDSVDWMILAQAAEKMTYFAYERWENDNRDNSQQEIELLREHNLDGDKTFIMSGLAIRCRQDESEYWKIMQNSLYQNLQVFRDSFKCTRGTPMHPKRRCNAW